MKQEQVNHPAHYNQHPAGIECIDVIRHYTCDIANAIKYLWRAGLKPEMGKEDGDKEIEDLNKALWYIDDYVVNCQERKWGATSHQDMRSFVKDITGYSIAQITKGYDEHIATAMEYLLNVGLIDITGTISVSVKFWKEYLDAATECIHRRILDIEMQLTSKELEDTVAAMHGQAIDGEDYIAKPGGVREDEPDKYDPLNMIVIYGRAYSLDDAIRKRDNGTLHTPCENCALMDVCYKDWQHPNEEECQNLCGLLHNADTNQYYREVGYCKYSPRFGTIEVVDEWKESELEMKRLKEEDENNAE